MTTLRTQEAFDASKRTDDALAVMLRTLKQTAEVIRQIRTPRTKEGGLDAHR